LYASSVFAEKAAMGAAFADDAGATSPQHQWIDNKHKRDFEARVQSIEALILAFRSVATETGNADQISVIESNVVLEIQQAQKHYDSEDYTTGRNILDRAYAIVKIAILKIRDGTTLVMNRSADEQYEIEARKSRGLLDYENRAQSIDALIAAYNRVAEEKDQQGQASVVEGNIADIVARATKHYEAGDYTAGLTLLKDAYALIKEALAALRDGDTLVRSLNFANKEEEYQYYVTKTHSQKTAIRILQKISANPARTARMNGLLRTAQTMLDEASALAAENKHEAAVPIMDKVLTRLQSGLMMALSSR
jgi:hypothetical protein